MLVQAITDFYRSKFLSSIIILACWPAIDRIKLTRTLSQYGLSATVKCSPSMLGNVHNSTFQGILYFRPRDENLLDKVNREHFSHWYKWLIIDDEIPKALDKVRYDADITIINSNQFDMEKKLDHRNATQTLLTTERNMFLFNSIYVHPEQGVSVHRWAQWTNTSGFLLIHEQERILRRLNLKGYPLKVVSPVGLYSEKNYNGTFEDYLEDRRTPQHDSAIRCAYGISVLMFQRLNASKELMQCKLWGTDAHNDSLVAKLYNEIADLGGGFIRPLLSRIKRIDYVFGLWPFSMGFTYLGERESSNNMYLEPFAASVWWACLVVFLILVVASWVTARNPLEKDGAFLSVLATWLQQDSSAVPGCASGRWTFMVMSVSSMLVHAYYTSAIVSALMSSGAGGPDSLRALADSKYTIASEDYDYIRFFMFNYKTRAIGSNHEELEYLKKKKLHPDFYQDIERGVKMILQGDTAYNAQFNHIYPYLRTFSDDNVCKLSYLDSTPRMLTFLSTRYRGQYSEVLKSTSNWIRETGLSKRILSLWQTTPPICRATILADKVKFGDVASLLGLVALGAVASLTLLLVEILVFKLQGKKRDLVTDTNDAMASNMIEYTE